MDSCPLRVVQPGRDRVNDSEEQVTVDMSVRACVDSLAVWNLFARLQKGLVHHKRPTFELYEDVRDDFVTY